ncbi:MAG: hypothetical protein DMG21_01170 [Acidobacteria bacterium]|nr:MAG: hypothetical protein DMG21_01170 [Acidobacteriota bacterium]
MADFLYRRLVYIFILILCVPFDRPLFSQNPAPTSQAKKTEAAVAAQKPRIVPLEEATRVSTDKALHSAAKDKSKPAAEEKKGPQLSGESEVTEFHPATPKEENSGGDPAASKKAKKSSTKHLHGTVYGASGSGSSGATAGGALGTTTKSGKTSVYVQSEKSRTANPNPH